MGRGEKWKAITKTDLNMKGDMIEANQTPAKSSKKPKLRTLDAKKTAAAKARLRAAKVKKLSLASLTPMTVDGTINGDFQVYARRKVLKWRLNTDVFGLPIDIEDLKIRPKNTEELRSQASERVKAMGNKPEHATSAVKFKDTNATMLSFLRQYTPILGLPFYLETRPPLAYYGSVPPSGTLACDQEGIRTVSERVAL
ncbi:hypothetical protein B0H10DRAFT_1970787 [Mycena sp. CBHHK59/15]|nr:hypothetical protein B0H10DRAFT_1970787 [Mycena sp. CBHHK59/15]